MADACAISIVIPVLNDTPALKRCLAALEPELSSFANVEIIVVDGGSDGACRRAAQRANATYLTFSKGRAGQMNTGASVARGTWLWFLHADCEPATGSLAALAALDERVRWGCFRHRIDSPYMSLRLIECADNFRARWLRLPYGDQGIFVRREDFERVGRFPIVPLLEDVQLARTLARQSSPRVLAPILRSDARRWIERGILRTTLTNWKIIWLYFVMRRRPEELAQIYR